MSDYDDTVAAFLAAVPGRQLSVRSAPVTSVSWVLNADTTPPTYQTLTVWVDLGGAVPVPVGYGEQVMGAILSVSDFSTLVGKLGILLFENGGAPKLIDFVGSAKISYP